MSSETCAMKGRDRNLYNETKVLEEIKKKMGEAGYLCLSGTDKPLREPQVRALKLFSLHLLLPSGYRRQRLA